jgi:hypothetical protein
LFGGGVGSAGDGDGSVGDIMELELGNGMVFDGNSRRGDGLVIEVLKDSDSSDVPEISKPLYAGKERSTLCLARV